MSTRKVTEKVFERVKLLQKGGMSSAETAEALGLGKSTVGFIRKASKFDEYNNIIIENHKKNDKRKAKTPAEEPTPVEEPVQIMEHRISIVANQYIMEQMRKQTELLTLINNKLTLIAEDLGCFKDEPIERADVANE